MQVMVGYMACGTAIFDTFFLDATNAGLSAKTSAIGLPPRLGCDRESDPRADGQPRPRRPARSRTLFHGQGLLPFLPATAQDLLFERIQSPGPDFEELWYFEDRTDVGDWLREHGWDVSVLNTEEMMP